jgi:hypothetical protein
MPVYGLRFFDVYSNEAVQSESFPAEDDVQAVRLAEGRRGLAPMELWLENRCLKRWETIWPLAWD